MKPKERFLYRLLSRLTKERWMAAQLLYAPPDTLKDVTITTPKVQIDLERTGI